MSEGIVGLITPFQVHSQMRTTEDQNLNSFLHNKLCRAMHRIISSVLGISYICEL